MPLTILLMLKCLQNLKGEAQLQGNLAKSEAEKAFIAQQKLL